MKLDRNFSAHDNNLAGKKTSHSMKSLPFLPAFEGLSPVSGYSACE